MKSFHVLNGENVHFSDHNSEQARLTRLPYHLGEDQKLPVHRVARVALLFCLLVSCIKGFFEVVRWWGRVCVCDVTKASLLGS